MNKRGLSGVVTTILVVAISIVAIVGVFVVVNGFLKSGANQISLSKLTVDAKIKSASINYTTDIASIRVKREIGPGDMVGLKFVFEDNKNSDVIERRTANFNELAERTFDINLSLEAPDLGLYRISKVSIAPIIKLESGEEAIGKVSDTYTGLNANLNMTQGENQTVTCRENIDCGTDYFLDGTKYCNAEGVYQYKKVYSCLLGFCYNSIQDTLVETCTSLCYDGVCIQQAINCTNQTVATDCGVDSFFGSKRCAANNKDVVQDYKQYQCINNLCSMNMIAQTIKTCNNTEVCFGGECFVPLECTQDSDCPPSKVCDSGHCVNETPINSGSVYSIWPFGIGEYFDSADLPNPSNVSYTDKYISFTSGAETRCFKVKEHKKPNVENSYAYIRLNETVTSVVAGNQYQILRTNYYCGRS